MPRFCTNCGNQLAEAVKFCNKCGTPIGTVAPPAQGRPTVVTPPAAGAPETQVWPATSSTTKPQQPAPTAPQHQAPSYQAPPPQTPPPAWSAPPPQQPQTWGAQHTGSGPSAGTGLSQNIAGLLCYLLIPAIIFLAVEPYNKNRFIRFHAFQSILLTGAWIILRIAFAVLTLIMPGFIDLLLGLLSLALGLGFFVLWIFMLVKAYNHEMFKLPVIGELAEEQAGRN